MMETSDKNRTTTIAVVTGIIALLFGLCLGALVGGAGGFLLGRQTSSQSGGEYVPDRIQVTPRVEVTPGAPVLPNLLNRSGALVREVIADTPAAAAGLRMGDIITAVDDIPIDANHRLADVLSQYRPGDRVTLEIQRGMRSRTTSVSVTLGENPNDRSRAYLGIYYVELPIDDTDMEPGD